MSTATVLNWALTRYAAPVNLLFSTNFSRSSHVLALCHTSCYYYFVARALFSLAVQVVIENPWMRVLDKLPDTLMRKRYGT